MSRADLPASSSMTLHGINQMAASAMAENNGALSILAHDKGGFEVFDLTIFTASGALAVELAAAINGVLVRHNRFHNEHGQVAA